MSASGDNLIELSVSELSGQVKRLVEDSFGHVRVRGELGRVSRPASGHVYFDVKDDKAVLAGVMWKGTAQKLSMQPEQGLEVRSKKRCVSLEECNAIHAFVIVSGDPFEKAACVRRDPFAGDGIGSAMDLGTMGASQFDIRLSSIKIIEIPDP